MRNKYHAEKTEIDGIKFASRKEARRYQELKLLQRAGVIKDLKLQVPFVLFEKNEYGRVIKYVADFTYYEGDQYVVEDVKGILTPLYKLKKRIVAEHFGIKIKEV